ncbi:hypothetical protein C8R47DRAFT_646988 [Mycena vitilis]|nr:hypothetical protein C8R47DRAFT_646988 [Mycena vitilis]
MYLVQLQFFCDRNDLIDQFSSFPSSAMPVTTTCPPTFPGLRIVPRDNNCHRPPHQEIISSLVTTDNEAMLRTYHPLLCAIAEVRVYENTNDSSDTAWVLSSEEEDIRLRVNRLGGRRVYYMPDTAFAWFYALVNSRMERDPYWCFLEKNNPPQPARHGPSDPRLPFPLDALPFIRNHFPTALGIRIYVFGIIAVLFDPLPSKSTLAEWNVPDTIAGMRYLLLPLKHIPTASTADLPPSTADKTNWTTELCSNASGTPVGLCSVGVALKAPSGQSFITTVTHGFVDGPLLRKKAALSAVSAILGYVPNIVRRAAGVAWANAEHLLGMNMTPVGSRVYMCLSDVRPRFCFGEIVKTYDTPSRIFPYPHGYAHDLSLIAATPTKTLPTLLWWSGAPQLDGFTTFDDVLASPDQPLFCMAPHLAEAAPLPPPGANGTPEDNEKYAKSLGIYAGSPIPEVEHNLIVEAREYLWERETMSTVKQTLLWRSSNADMAGASGGPVCFGHPAKTTASLVCFQSFQAPADVVGRIAYHGGFVIPSEITAGWEILPGLAYKVIPTSQSMPQTDDGGANTQRITASSSWPLTTTGLGFT